MFRRVRDAYDGADASVRLVGLAVLVIVLVLIAPRYLPINSSGVDCVALAAPPLNGNSQSILANQDDGSGLLLELVAESQTIVQGQSLVLYVRFINAGMAPVNLFLVENEILFRYSGQEVGLQFSIVNPLTRGVLGEPASVRPPVPLRQQYTPREVRYQQPRSRCTVRVQISPQRLSAAGLGLGEYEITARYENRIAGALQPIGPLTPTPVFTDQGVWTGESQSNTILVSIVQALPQ